MNFLKKGIEYNKLAKAFNGIFLMINEFEEKVKRHKSVDYIEFGEEVLILANLSRKEILDSFEIYNWPMTGSIAIPMIAKKRIHLVYAYQQTIGRLYQFGENM